MSDIPEPDLEREVILLRHRLTEANQALASAEDKVSSLQVENVALRERANTSQEQLRRVRSTPAWKRNLRVQSAKADRKARAVRTEQWLRSAVRRFIK